MSYPHTATCKFKVASWSESAYVDGEGTRVGELYHPKRGLSKAEVSYSYSGDVEGTGTLVYLIAYKADAAPVLGLGLGQFTGSIGGHEGSCVFRHVGSQDAGSVSARLEVVPGMGTGGLESLVGEAALAIAGHRDDGYDLVLSYDLG